MMALVKMTMGLALVAAALAGCGRGNPAPTASEQAQGATRAFLSAMAAGDEVLASRWAFHGLKDAVGPEIRSNRRDWPADFNVAGWNEVLRDGRLRVFRVRYSYRDAAGVVRSREALAAGDDGGASVLGIMDFDEPVLPPMSPGEDPAAPRVDRFEVWPDPDWGKGASVQIIVGQLKRRIRKGRIDSLDPPEVAASVAFDNAEGPSPTISPLAYRAIPSSPWMIVSCKLTFPKDMETRYVTVRVTDALTGRFAERKSQLRDFK